jgi:hypothetical protein
MLCQKLGNVSKRTELKQLRQFLTDWDTFDSKATGYELDDRISAPSRNSIFLTASTSRPAAVTSSHLMATDENDKTSMVCTDISPQAVVEFLRLQDP